MEKIENYILKNYLSNLKIPDKREENVLVSYIRAFNFLVYENDITNILEIGAGNSSILFSLLSKRLNLEIDIIDMKKSSLLDKLKNKKHEKQLTVNLKFNYGKSISDEQLNKYYSNQIKKIGSVEINKVLENSDLFLDYNQDNRKLNDVLKLLGENELNSSTINKIFNNEKFKSNILNLYSTPLNEFTFQNHDKKNVNLLEKIMGTKNIDLVYLDSGEFSSLPEWDIVNKNIKQGGIIVLHDIFFPKSFKNFLVASSIKADSNWDIIHFDNTTPQGILIAKKVN